MENYIQYLLNTNLRIIIPDFGAFIIRQKEPLVIVFNELLRYNDGLLIDYIARHENIDKDMAKHQVTEFTEDLVKALAGGKAVNLEGIGTLQRTGEDKIEFVQAGKTTAKRIPKKPPETIPDEPPAEKTVTFELEPEQPPSGAKTAIVSKADTGRKKEVKPLKAETRPKASKNTEKKPQAAEKITRAPEKLPAAAEKITQTPEK
jgi:nucleoid DNA-binding protein